MSIWDLFGSKDPKDLFLDYNPQGSHWRVVTWNFDLEKPLTRKWTVEVHGEKTKIIHWEKNETEELSFFEGRGLVRKRKMKLPHDQFKALMNIALHSTLKYSLEINHEFMVTPVSGATTQDMQNESRSLQWIQATFGTLVRALDSMKNKKDLILKALLKPMDPEDHSYVGTNRFPISWQQALTEI